MHLKNRSLRGLLTLNAALLAVLAFVALGGGARAESEARAAAGDFVMAGGSLNGSTSNAVYVLDQRSGVLVAFLYDRSSKRMTGLDVRNAARDAQVAAGGGR